MTQRFAIQRHLPVIYTATSPKLLIDRNGTRFDQAHTAFLSVLPTLPERIILVGNETSMDIIPIGELTR